MDVVWIILDSLSFSATPFSDDGPRTMPELEQLAEDHARVFTDAYAPGPASPSSHASFFTGKLPSETGMYEASPYYDGAGTTIAEALSDTHESLLISSNPFVFNGLQTGFDETDDLQLDPLFENAMHPVKFTREDSGDGPRKYLEYLLKGGRPVRSVFNGLHYKLMEREEHHRHAETITRRVQEFVSRADRDVFVVANYMDVHPPLEASDRALSQFAPDTDRTDLPNGVDGQKINERVNEELDYEAEDMHRLYRAAICDLDRTIAPLIKALVRQEALVVVTADHGQWFDRNTELDDDRIHVPLLIFEPSGSAETVRHTVNIRSLPRTTMDALGMDHDFDGEDLTEVTEDQVSITEFIHNEASVGKPVTPEGGVNDRNSISYRSVLIEDATRVDFDGETTATGESGDRAQNLERIAESIFQEKLDLDDASIEYDDRTENRLRELGYLE